MLQKNVSLTTSLPISTCVTRLREVTSEGFFAGWRIFNSKPVIGAVKDTGFKWHKLIRYQNSFQTYLSGTFSTRDGKTHINCTSGMNRSTKIFLVAWPLMVGLITLPGLFEGGAITVNGQETQDPTTLLIFAGLFMSFAFVLAAFGRFIARREHSFMLNLLSTTIEAQIADNGHGELQHQPTTRPPNPARPSPAVERR